jgi:hypothetical protein
MEEGKLKNLLIVVLTVGFLILLFEALGWFRPVQINAATQQREAACDEIRNAYANVLYRVWIDNPSYVEDVLTECDEWCNLYDLVGDMWINYKFKSIEDSLMYESNLSGSITYDPTCINWVYIPDSTYRKLRQVFPDLPAEQNRPDKKLKNVEPIELQ